jgi:NADH:ubiquinone oxidoreductase subunit F (NADH-binding)
MERNPHLLFEGCLIGCWAIGAKVAYIYIRGEFYHVQRLMEAELAKAYAQGYCGKNIMGSGFDCDIVIHRGAGAYEAGEETALGRWGGARARVKPRSPVSSSTSRPRSTTSRRSATCRRSSPTARSGSPSSAPRRTAARSCTASAAT